MKKITKRQMLLFVLSIVLSLGIMYPETYKNVQICFTNPGCDIHDAGNLGDLTYIKHGYPLIYLERSSFKETPNYPGDTFNINETVTHTNYLNIVVNVVFWYALLSFLAPKLRKLKR